MTASVGQIPTGLKVLSSGGTLNRVILDLTESVSCQITLEKHLGYHLEFFDDDLPVFSLFCESAPWFSPIRSRRVAEWIYQTLNPATRPDKSVLKNIVCKKFQDLQKQFANQPELQHFLLSDITSRIIAQTECARLHPGETPTLSVVIAGTTFGFSTDQIISCEPAALKKQYFNNFYQTLSVSWHDWQVIRNYWLEIAAINTQDHESSLGAAECAPVLTAM